MSPKILRALMIMFSVVALRAGDSTSVEAFHKRATDRSRLSKEAKTHPFFLHLLVSGGWGPETASYEVHYDGPLEDLHPFVSSAVTGVIIRRDLKGEKRTTLDKYSLSELVTQCIDQELFELSPKKHWLSRPQGTFDSFEFWVFIKYGDAENFFGRTAESAPVGAIYHTLTKLIQGSEAPQEKDTAKP